MISSISNLSFTTPLNNIQKSNPNPFKSYLASNSNFPKITPEKLSLDIDENNYIGKILHIWRFKVNKNM